MKKILLPTLLFIIMSSCVLYASAVPTVYINNKPFTGKIFTYKSIIYLEAATALTYLNIPNSTTDTVLKIKDPAMETKLSKIAVMIDYQDGRGSVISFPLKALTDAIGGRYTYYGDTNTVDVVSFTRKVEQPAQQTTQQTTQQTQHTTGNTNSGGTTSSYSGNNNSVNLFNTKDILTNAQNAANGAQNK